MEQGGADYSFSRPKKSDSSRKRPARKRSYTRKAATALINTAEARREIVNALHIHRSQSSSSIRQLTDSLPAVAQPTWSTTPPAVHCAPVPAAMDVLEVEWYDNVSSSYSWWLEFLKSLDTKKQHAVNETSNVLRGACLAARVDVDKTDDDDPNNTFTDEWVIFPPESQEQLDTN